MAIKLVSDLVADVMRAVAPQRVAAARTRISGAKAAEGFAKAEAAARTIPGTVKALSTDIVAGVVNAAEPTRLKQSVIQLAGSQEKALAANPILAADAQAAAPATARSKANQQFEAAMLRSFTEDMMPKQTSSLYGEGTAGNIWRSLQVDLMSQSMAKAGGIGIADMLDKAGSGKNHTAGSLALNELGSAARSGTALSTTGEWPYFRVGGDGA